MPLITGFSYTPFFIIISLTVNFFFCYRLLRVCRNVSMEMKRVCCVALEMFIINFYFRFIYGLVN
jgi:hypothetical protein